MFRLHSYSETNWFTDSDAAQRKKNNMKQLHDVIHTHTHLDQDSDVSWEHNTTNFNNDLRKNFTCDCTVQNKFRRIISQKEKKNIRRSTQRSALCKINRPSMRWRSHAIVKPLVVKHAHCPVRALSQWDALIFCFASLQWLCYPALHEMYHSIAHINSLY